MPEDLKLSQIGSSQLPRPFRGLHSPGVRKHCQIIFACYFRKSSIRSGHRGSWVENETGHSIDLESVTVDELGHSGSRNRNRGWIAIFAHSNLGFRSRNLAHQKFPQVNTVPNLDFVTRRDLPHEYSEE